MILIETDHAYFKTTFRALVSYRSLTTLLLLMTFNANQTVAATGLCEQNAELAVSYKLSLLLHLACTEVKKNRWIPAIHYYQQVLALAPDNRQALRNRALLLSKLGAAKLAEWRAKQHPDLL